MKLVKNVPQLRFSGFDDEWEEKKLGEISSKVSKKNTDNLITETFTNSAEFGIISQRDFFDHDISNDENIDGYFIVENDDFVYNPRISTIAPVGPINRNKLGRSGVMSPLYYVFRTHDIDKSFLEKYFKSECWYDFMFLNGNSGARSDRFSITDSVFTQMPIRVPRNKLEQQKIGTFLSHVDSLIQAKTKKLESLKAVKKSLLQKCFPKAGQKVPEMRFESNQEWASINFEDCFSFLSNNSFSRDELNYEKGYIKSLHYGDVLIKFGEILNVSTASLPYITQINSPKQYSKSILKNGDIVIADAAEDNTVGKCTEIQNCTELLAAGLHTIAVRPKIEFAPTFLGFCINSESFHNQLLPLIQGTKVSSISKSAIVDTVIYYPISITEQQKIGQFFSKYDSLISAQQKEIDKLKDIKKSLLQKMFV